MKSRLLVPLAVLAAAALGACGKDPFAVNATADNVADTLIAAALNGTPPGAQAGINTPFHAVVRVDSSFNFDVALDIAQNGDLLVVPVSRVGSILGVSRRIGLNVMDTSIAFDSVKKAPASGYVLDSVRTFRRGQTVVVQAVSPYCNSSLNGSAVIYSKFVVDSVKVPSRTFYLRMVVDPNCGFRSFLPGLPSS